MVDLGFRDDEGSKILKDTKWVNFNVNLSTLLTTWGSSSAPERQASGVKLDQEAQARCARKAINQVSVYQQGQNHFRQNFKIVL